MRGNLLVRFGERGDETDVKNVTRCIISILLSPVTATQISIASLGTRHQIAI
ncbi:hypothetical protein TRICHSKD4_0547 [Roseibium sp. TrichSKD4]|uniref:hypothetical protein n=1 Tax=Roseibium sp. TrichSKD4 TaxID=744980 RepID=UPI0001E5653D|nr:hypothetical protein [Roseibium sp. TrichSKD4]EFO34059.1 hypothetical protein TRICHSKD4_0547 [Roseibium sp. TrichSKD4]